MKKTLIALAVLAASGAAMAQSSVNVFGTIDAGVTYLKNSGSDSNYGISNSGNAVSRLGFRGVEDLGGGLKAGFWLEGALQNDTGNAGGLNFQRRSTLSLQGNFGEVRLGRDTVAGYATSKYDVFGQAGIGQFQGWTAQTGGIDRLSNTVAYFTPNFGGFTGGLNYGFGETAGSSKSARYIGAYGAFDNGPLSVTLAADRLNGGANTSDLPLALNQKSESFSIGASYDLGFIKPTGLYKQAKIKTVAGVDQKVNSWALGLTAPVGAVGEVRAMYSGYDFKSNDSDAQQLSLGYVHNLSKRTALYTTVSFIKNKDGATLGLNPSGVNLAAEAGKNQTGFQAGIRHNF